MSNSTGSKLNEMLRGERAATETYAQALEKVGTDPRADGLREIQSDHIQAIQELQKHLEFRGEEVDDGIGSWGVFAKTIMGSAKLLGDHTALMALKQGEEYGLNMYAKALENDDIPPKVKSLVRGTLIPMQHAHNRKIEAIANVMQ
ncbi:DUF2383 domain-containing protein [Pseudobacteriovorax antillogorgiicola]|nr:DUF2383 domain-containing protein [Pseudobacteriovorax antillogorgiicola]